MRAGSAALRAHRNPRADGSAAVPLAGWGCRRRPGGERALGSAGAKPGLEAAVAAQRHPAGICAVGLHEAVICSAVSWGCLPELWALLG